MRLKPCKLLVAPLAGLGVGLVGGDHERGMCARLAAARRLQLARARLGAKGFELVVLCVVEDWSWPALARQLRVTQAGAKRMVAEAVERLPSKPPGGPYREESLRRIRGSTPCPRPNPPLRGSGSPYN
jgi:hypothetical protein